MTKIIQTLTLILIIIFCSVRECYLGVTYNYDDELGEFYGETYNTKKQCPYCDSSVFSYCGEKLFHDSCCCNNPNNPHYPLPYQCQFADCSFLHANSCYEHKLITACCCLK